MGKCIYDKPWQGHCGEKTVEGEQYCEEHLAKKCKVCGEQATHGCPTASSLVCGAPLCEREECRKEHYKRGCI